MKPQTQYKVKSLMDASYQSGVFCFHGSKQQSLEPMIQARCLTLQLPSRLDESSVDRLCYEMTPETSQTTANQAQYH